MLYLPLLAVVGSALSANGAAVTPTKSDRSSKTWTLTPVVVQTPTPTAVPVANKHVGNLTSDAAQVASLPFATNCCGWAGVYGWTASGSAVASMNGVCLSPLTSSTLDINTCLGWNPSSGESGCPNTGNAKGGFLSGCKVAGAPNVLPIGSIGPASTMIYTICSGPAANTLYITALDLSLCVGVASNGQLACY